MLKPANVSDISWQHPSLLRSAGSAPG